MATVAEWVEGARLRTLPAAVAPVFAGTATAHARGLASPTLAGLAMVVALALQVGVNYANDYSDGTRGADTDRVGPQRLVGSGAASPAVVRAAAFGCFALAAITGLVVVLITQHWWLVALGALSILAAWFYTGGDHPYGYHGLGEVMVFIFFGLVAVCGTTYVMTDTLDVATVLAATGIGSLACAILVANNLRDAPTDATVGKRTLATKLGDRRTRLFYLLLLVVAAVCVLGVVALTTWWALLALAMLAPLAPAARIIASGVVGLELVRVLKLTGIAELFCGLGLLVGVVIGSA